MSRVSEREVPIFFRKKEWKKREKGWRKRWERRAKGREGGPHLLVYQITIQLLSAVVLSAELL